MRILFALPGLHRYNRGAEVAFIAIARGLAEAGNSVTLIGSGNPKAGTRYRFLNAPSIPRERFENFPTLPLLRNEFAYEELTFVPGLLRRYRPRDFDVTLTCGYPFTNWILRRPILGNERPPHVFVTENGDWPAVSAASEYRYFGCDGLVCTNQLFFERNKARWHCGLIPNGVDCERFQPGADQRQEFGLPPNRLVVLMASALVPNKRVELGIEAVSKIPDAQLVVAGDGFLREQLDDCAARLLPGRFTRLMVDPDRMPHLYRSADVFLHLCKDESFGNVFLEAMASGLPIVACDTSHVRWIVGDDEFLVENDDPAAIALQISSARNSAFAMKAQRKRKAAQFSWTRIVEMYSEFLNTVVNSAGSKVR